MPAKHQLLFVQGGGEGTHDEWDHKLVASLREHLGQTYDVRYPRLPREDEPSFARWRPALEKELRTLSDGVILVGHSLGATMLLKLLAERATVPKPGAIFLLAAPFVGDGGWLFEELKLPPDLGARLPPGVPVHFFHGLEDETAPSSHLDLYARAVPHARVHRLPGRDHQLNENLREVAASILALR